MLGLTCVVYKSKPRTFANVLVMRHRKKKGFGHAKELGNYVIACQGLGDANELGDDVIKRFLWYKIKSNGLFLPSTSFFPLNTTFLN